LLMVADGGVALRYVQPDNPTPEQADSCERAAVRRAINTTLAPYGMRCADIEIESSPPDHDHGRFIDLLRQIRAGAF